MCCSSATSSADWMQMHLSYIETRCCSCSCSCCRSSRFCLVLGLGCVVITNPNPKVRKSGAVGKAVLAQDSGFDGTKPSFFNKTNKSHMRPTSHKVVIARDRRIALPNPAGGTFP